MTSQLPIHAGKKKSTFHVGERRSTLTRARARARRRGSRR